MSFCQHSWYAHLVRWLMVFLLTGWVWAHPLAESARALGDSARVLQARLGNSPAQLSWGEQMASQDLLAVEQAGQALALQLEAEALDWDGSWLAVQQLQSAATRWKMSRTMLTWGQEEQLVGDGLLASAQQLEQRFKLERQAEFERRIDAGRPQPVWRSNWNWGWGWGSWGARPIWVPRRWGRGCR
jgi:hypothetical protein